MAIGALGDLVSALGGGERIAGIGLTGQCPTVAPVAADGAPVGPGLMYRDNRATAEALQMREEIGVAQMHARTGHVAEAFHVGPKILWMRAHRRDAFAAARYFMQPRDVVLLALTGEIATDETHANSTVFFGLSARAWAEDLLERFSLDPAIFPPVMPPWSQVGALTDAVSRRTGAPCGCPVVIGAADSQCAAFGSGVNDPGPISEMAGASSCLNSIVREPLADPRVTHYSHVIPGCYCTELGINTTGAAVRWAVAKLGYPNYDALESAASVVYDAIAAGAVQDPLDAAPLFLPFLGDGERNDVTLRGAFIGLADRHGREELAYAVLEGVAFSVAEVVAVLNDAGSACEELRVAGGGARLSTLGAIKADALAVPVFHLQADTAAVGVALLAARNLGYGAEVELAIAAGLQQAARFQPSSVGKEVLARRREWFRLVCSSTAVRLGAPSAEGALR